MKLARVNFFQAELVNYKLQYDLNLAAVPVISIH